MKKVASLWWILVIAAILISGCEKSNQGPEQNPESLSLEEAVNKAALNIDNAVEAIEASNAYELFNRTSTTKATTTDDAPAHSIYLEDIAGVYEYDPVEDVDESAAKLKAGCKWYFKWLEDSDLLILHLPFEKVKKPASLFKYDPEEEWTNNLKITTSQFLYEADKMRTGHNYELATRFDVDEEYAGELWVNETRSNYFKTKSSSKFGFTEEYFIKVIRQFGDTIMLSYSLENAEGDTLYSEKVSLSINMVDDKPKPQFEYEIQVGDVRIVKMLDEDNKFVYVVYKGGELREDAIVNVIILDGEEPTSIDCMFMHKNKDLQIMLSDEPPIQLSELIGDSQEVLADLFASMKELYLSKQVINKLAWQIYREEMCDELED
ncbi:hypothetical protein [Carboxylicivirga marina]|uniref:Lipoprotein n=1 Tax=Carboxylicivirga marina TaxID=2800988 RepID=A0ABS1HGW7_9BACT|nr:hypothetical protein [Carboxylicivirga marina]MBK3516909.1 hypothetical protein [Carboxylicivirga marina]